MKTQDDLVDLLNDDDPVQRRDALTTLAREHADALPPAGTNVNMHCHSFYSYNADGFSPSRIAWEGRKAGWYAAGLCDFDVLDGLEEFLTAGRLLGLRSTANLETRAFLEAYADVDISSPGEPGVTYIMGAGFARELAPGTPQALDLQAYRNRARARNVALVGRVNPHIPDIAIDYERDVLPLTPAGAATERHIISAYVNKARDTFVHLDRTAAFWAPVLGKDEEKMAALLTDLPAFEEVVRAKLVKRGGLGYEQPSPDTFPTTEAFIRWVAACDAIPMVTWLDGTSDGEKDPNALLECMTAQGAAALNIIPDRNWNLGDPEAAAVKQAHLKDMVEAADRLGLPINVGTEMNKQGLPFVDDLAEPALRPYRNTFLHGARIVVGHTLLQRYAGFSYTGSAAAEEFLDVHARNTFFAAVGALPPLTVDRAQQLLDMGSEKALAWFREKAADILDN